ncbi:hypothetical protein M9Y10_039199 [Tritrichomonas musculus]|uniref:mitogen-activated protein kinase kinase n=1 Tax=Tritrichomonas musculus TaxID=1915356 RepID=A0ABR2KCE1_9EUKA
MEFLNENICKNATDIARELNHQEIIDLLSKKPIKTTKTQNKKINKSQESNAYQYKNRQLEDEISNLKKENIHLKDENAKLREKNRNINERLEKVQKKQSLEEKNELRILDESEIENLENIEEIGSGGGGKVIKVAMKKIYALKQMIINDFNIKNFQNFIKEYEIMNMLQHPNVLKAIGIFMSNKNIPPSILLEYCPINLHKAIKNKVFSKEELVKIIYQIVEAMKFIHFKKIIHRDLKPTNILIDSDGTVKICDFGISKLMTVEEQTMTRGIGSQKFMAPEIINEEDYYDEKVDVYSFGVLLFFILSDGQLPKIRIADIFKGKKAEIPSSFTELSKNLIKDCWNLKSKDRPSFQLILEVIEKNRYNLIQLNKAETKNIESFVKQHKTKIQQYIEKPTKITSKLPSLH